MRSVTIFNQERFLDWLRLQPIKIDDEDFQRMADWCDETFGPDGVGVTHHTAYVYYDHPTHTKRKMLDVRLCFKHEADLAFFQLRYGNGLQHVK